MTSPANISQITLFIDDVDKFNIANELVNAIYNFTQNELKAWLYCLAALRPAGTNNNTYIYRINCKEVAIELGILKDKNSFNRTIFSLYRNIKKKEIRIVKKTAQKWDDGNYLDVNFFSSVEYDKGFIEVVIDPKLHQYLFNLTSGFTELQRMELCSLSSTFAIRVYILLMQVKNVGYREDDIEEFKKLLRIEEKYKSFADLRRYVLNKAEEELRSKTSMRNLYYTTDARQGVKATRICWTLYPNMMNITETPARLNTREKKPVLLFDEKQKKLYETLKKLHISERRAKKFVESIEPVVIESNIAYCKKQFANKELDDQGAAAYLARAISDDYAKGTRSKAEQKRLAKARADELAKEQIELIEKETAVADIYESYLADLSAAKFLALLEKIAAYAVSSNLPFDIEAAKREGKAHFSKSLRAKLLLHKYIEIYPNDTDL